MHGIGAFVLVAAIAFAFGERVAQRFVGAVLLAGLAGLLYIMFRIMTGTI